MDRQDDIVNLDTERRLQELREKGIVDMIEGFWCANLERLRREHQGVVSIHDYKMASLPFAPLHDMFLYQAWSRKSQLEAELDLAAYNDVVHGERDASVNSRVRPVIADFLVNGFSSKNFKDVEVYNGHLVPLIMLAEGSIVHTSGYYMKPSHALIMANIFRQKYLGNVETIVLG